MPRRGGNAFRLSRAPDDARRLNNYPGRYPVEPWHAHYWTVQASGALEDRSVVLELPAGYAAGLPRVPAGEPGCVSRVRTWGLMCSPGRLDEIGFDAGALVTHDPERFPRGEDQEWLHIYLTATTFDLPGRFIIADQDYAMLLFDPEGELRGSWVAGPTYLAALTWLVTHGKICADFFDLQVKDTDLYRRAVAEMLAALPRAS
jgi:hypothetical protein